MSLPLRGFPALILLFLLVGGCSPPSPRGEIRDVLLLPQHPSFYLRDGADDLLLPPETLRASADNLQRIRFSFWEHAAEPKPSEKVFWALTTLRQKEVFGENRRRIEPAEIAELIRHARVDEYPSLDLPAITVRNGDLRAMPTARPCFLDFSRPGEGFPFDYFQNSAVWANTPVRLRHRSADGAWVLVETAMGYGWLPADAVATVDEALMDSFRGSRQLVLTRDDTPLFSPGGAFRFTGGLGAFVPLLEESPERFRGLAAHRGADGSAHAVEVFIPRDAAEIFPLPLTSREVARLADPLMGQHYGWGGLYGNRDCSATMLDLFAPFGIWLPRNSSRQAQAGEVLPLGELFGEEKEKAILDGGIPFLTLIWMKGHIGLYLGEHQGRAAFLHNVWGVKTESFWGEEGRAIVGKTVVTTLQPGAELGVGEGLRARVLGMTILRGTPTDPALSP